MVEVTPDRLRNNVLNLLADAGLNDWSVSQTWMIFQFRICWDCHHVYLPETTDVADISEVCRRAVQTIRLMPGQMPLDRPHSCVCGSTNTYHRYLHEGDLLQLRLHP